jgi:hypothetical protein
MSNDHQRQLPGVTETSSSSTIRIAHLGNSIQYFNDCPRFLQRMISSSSSSSASSSSSSSSSSSALTNKNSNKNSTKMTVIQDSCLRGGA